MLNRKMYSQIMKTLVVVALVLVYVRATTLTVQNNCGDPIDVIRTENDQDPVLHQHLDPGDSYSEDFGDGRGMNFKSGWEGKTLAEFTFDGYDGQDSYDLSVINDFDVGMKIEGPGDSVTCFDPGCPDAYHSDDELKTHTVATGGEFTLSFCS